MNKKQVLDVRVTVRRVTFEDPEAAAAALERWQRSTVMMFKLLDRYEAQEAAIAAEQSEISSFIVSG